MCGTGARLEQLIRGQSGGTNKVGRAHPKKEDLPPKKSSSPSGGPTRLGIGRKSSTRKRGGVSGRSRSKRKAFSRS